MSGRLLDFKQYIGGADNVITLELFQRSRKTYTYDFGFNVSGYTFSSDYQSILLDTVTYDRATGLPNFTDTTVLGYFDNYSTISSSFFNTGDAATGTVVFTIPEDRYTGLLFPNARSYVVATVVSVQWDDSADAFYNTHRFLILERWEPGSNMGDPRTNVTPAFTSLAVSS